MDGHIVYYPDNFQYDDTPVFSEEWLWREYWDKGLSMRAIADKYGTSILNISELLYEYGIQRRERGGAYLAWLAGRRMETLIASGKMHMEPTSIEIALYGELDRLGIEHIRQYSPEGFPKIYDAFVHPNVLVETHGDYWHSSPKALINDEKKEAWAYDNGYVYVAIWEHEINEIGIVILVADRIVIQLKGNDNEKAT